jgi:outer membrane protein, heavy metal efflux system
VLAGVGGAFAQQAPPRPLSLSQALGIADRNNLDLVAARRRRAVSEAGIRVAGARPNPTFNFTALRDEPHEGVFFDQTIELGGKRGHRIEEAREEGRLTDIDISTLERQVRRTTREGYYNLALARAETARLGKVVQLAERLRDIARDRFQAGDIPELEVIQAELELSRAQADFQVAAEEEKVALSELNVLLNEPATNDWQLASSLTDALPPADLPSLIERAAESNPELQRLAEELNVERSRHSLLKAERIPNLDLQFGLDFNAPRDFRVGPRSQVSLGLPLFYRNQGEIAQSLSTERVLEAEAAATRRSVEGNVERAYLDQVARQTQVDLYGGKLLPAARHLAELAEESYKAGKANILTVMDAQRNAEDVEKTYLDSLFALQSAFAVVEETVGVSLGQP